MQPAMAAVITHSKSTSEYCFMIVPRELPVVIGCCPSLATVAGVIGREQPEVNQVREDNRTYAGPDDVGGGQLVENQIADGKRREQQHQDDGENLEKDFGHEREFRH